MRTRLFRCGHAVLLALAIFSAPACADYIDYTITVSKPLVHGTESIGGQANPVIYVFRVDRSAPNLSGASTTNGTYPIGDHGVGGFGSVTVGGVTSVLQGGLINVQNAPGNDAFTAATNLQTNNVLIGGRTLFVSTAHLAALTGQMFSNIDLPLTNNFASYTGLVDFRLIFFPKPGDPEYGTGSYVQFDMGFVPPQGDVRVDVRLVVSQLPFAGFFPPVEGSSVVNSMKAGAAVPVKFSLGGDRGLDVMAAGFPVSQQIACPGGAALAPIQELTVTAGNSTLNYDVATDTYTYAWKTDKTWSGTCRLLNVRLTDGIDHTAVFHFN